ncbi:MAG: hypothetical protein FDW93_05490 [Bergeyella sp.]|nr:hypothetical protein [Bergeyella sp.]
MKKSLFILLFAFFFVFSCRKSDSYGTLTGARTVAEQNSNDDAAIKKYMEEHYFNGQGLVKSYSGTGALPADFPRLSEHKSTKLPSGVIIVMREGAQPAEGKGKTIGDTDIIRLMSKTSVFTSGKGKEGKITYNMKADFENTIEGSGVPKVDPYYYYVKKDILEKNKRTRAYYEIKGFQEGVRYFKSCEIGDEENYNLQGVIMVPSRAAYGRNDHFTQQYTDASFVFNFQVYKTTPRPEDQE